MRACVCVCRMCVYNRSDSLDSGERASAARIECQTGCGRIPAHGTRNCAVPTFDGYTIKYTYIQHNHAFDLRNGSWRWDGMGVRNLLHRTGVSQAIMLLGPKVTESTHTRTRTHTFHLFDAH